MSGAEVINFGDFRIEAFVKDLLRKNVVLFGDLTWNARNFMESLDGVAVELLSVGRENLGGDVVFVAGDFWREYPDLLQRVGENLNGLHLNEEGRAEALLYFEECLFDIERFAQRLNDYRRALVFFLLAKIEWGGLEGLEELPEVVREEIKYWRYGVDCEELEKGELLPHYVLKESTCAGLSYDAFFKAARMMRGIDLLEGNECILERLFVVKHPHVESAFVSVFVRREIVRLAVELNCDHPRYQGEIDKVREALGRVEGDGLGKVDDVER